MRTSVVAHHRARPATTRRTEYVKGSQACMAQVVNSSIQHGHSARPPVLHSANKPHANDFGFFVHAEKHVDERRLCASRAMDK